MEWIMILKAVLALAFVLGLLLLTLWLFKYCELHGAKNRFFKKLQDTQRLKIEEIRRIDARNSVVLVKKDQTGQSRISVAAGSKSKSVAGNDRM